MSVSTGSITLSIVCLAVGCLPAQGVVRFVAPLVVAENATAAPEVLPMVGIQVILLGIATVGAPTLSVVTDSTGAAVYPTGFTPLQALVGGPENSAIFVGRHIEYPPGSLTYIPVRSVASIPINGAGPYDISAYPVASPLNADLTATQCAAFHHVRRAHERLGPLAPGVGNGPLDVVFGTTSLGGPAEFSRADDAIYLAALADPDTSLAGRSASTLAHEYAHRVIEYAYRAVPALLLPRMNEGIADYLASTVTGWSTIGLGAITAPRDVDNGERYLIDFNGQRHHDGLVVGGALYHARQLFALHGRAVYFDNLFAAVLPQTPRDEPHLLRLLLQLDDDDNNLANCTPNSDLLFEAFTTMHSIPWPLATGCTPTITGTITALAGGWAAPAGTTPNLRGSLASNATSVGLRADFSASAATVSGQLGFFQGSFAPASPVQFGPGLAAYLDLSRLLPPSWFFTDGTGAAIFTATLPVGAPMLTFHAAILDPLAPLGVAVSNGIRVGP